ncbi:MAG: integrase [Clostridia bacterium]|nr:integrase [Clostridia bacterium]
MDTYINDPVALALNEEKASDTRIEIIEDPDFSYEGFQVVRGEFFAHMYEPSITFNNCKVSLNTACIKKLPEVEYVQILVNPETMKLAVRPCNEDDKDSFLWCNNKNGKRKPKQITCRLFFAKLVSLMGWNPNYRYKMLGKIIKSGDDFLILFDLNATEMYQRTVKDDGKIRTSRTPIFPAEWQDQFGLPVEEHQKLLQVNIFDGYTVFGVQEKKENNAPTAELTIESIPEGGENV